MAQRKSAEHKRPIEPYEHTGQKRLNNPPAGLVNPQTDPDAGKKTYAYDPHLDPQLVWAGKAEHTSFEVPTVSLHVHERIDPRTIIEAVRRRNGEPPLQLSLFDQPDENPPLRDAIEFYKHSQNWTNRLIAGDSLLVMNSLLEKEGMAGKVQMIYIDPPYGVEYGSNFQPFVNKRDVRDGNDEDLTAEPEMVKAFRDTWELGIHSYLSYLRDRLLLARELLSDRGSIFVQINDENLHLVRCLLDEVLGVHNWVGVISYKVTGGTTKARGLPQTTDFLLWYAKDRPNMTFRRLFLAKELDTSIFSYIEEPDGARRALTDEEKGQVRLGGEPGWRFFCTLPMHSKGAGNSNEREFHGRMWRIPAGMHWRHSDEGFCRLVASNRVVEGKSALRSVAFFDDFPYTELTASWSDTAPEMSKQYAVQTAELPIQRCILMTTDPGDLVFDPTCGSGTTAHVAEQWGRRWITCDTSRVAITLAKQRLMTAVYDYYELARPEEGVDSGFVYKTVPHVTLRSIANNPDIREGMTRAEIDAAIARHAAQETLYDQPLVDRSKVRVTGPFTVEAVPAPEVRSPDEVLAAAQPAADLSVARSGETLRQAEWRDELLKTGIRGKNGQYIRFARLEPMPGCRYLHAEGETRPSDEGSDRVSGGGTAYAPQRIVVSFGPEHAPLEQRQVGLAIEEALTLVPRPRLIAFAAFQFDPEAAKDIDETNWPGVTLLKVQMSADLLTEDLKKKRAGNDSFWLIGQPDVRLERIADGQHQGKYRVSVHGFDYYNTRTGNIESGGANRIAVWLLDPDYDGRSLFPRQVFFPMADESGGWARLARTLRAEIDEELIEAYRGTVSLPFAAGDYRRIAVKVVDDRGIESLRVMELE